jgi:2-polyprenyl-6-methoxyphenol hydroxylase-like FAD-dependent oxidoreductase
MVSIGVVGAGIAGLHLGLALRAADVAVTVYTERSFEDLAGGPLVNTVAHHHPLLDRERGMGIAPEPGTAYRAHHYHAGGLGFTGRAAQPSCAVDHRLHLPRLAAELAGRGGRIEVRRVGPRDLDGLAARHDLLTIATGRGAMSGLFPRIPQHSPQDLGTAR